jgi:methionine aminopeptidase
MPFNEVWLLYNVGNKAVGLMKAGQTFTIEPMINAGKFVTMAKHNVHLNTLMLLLV